MKKPLLNRNDVSPACSLCAHGIITADRENVLCVKSGVRLPESRCNKFKYDPLKRIPPRHPVRTEFTEEDFKL